MRPVNFPIVSSGVAGTASFTSSSAWFMDVVRSSFQITISSGSCVGTFQLQASNDPSYGQGGVPVGQFTPTHWSAVGSSTTIICSSSATIKTFLIPAAEMSYEHVRIVYTDGSGAAAVGVYDIRAKTLGL